ncbi:MAG: 30S ribosomal protein S20 [Candidatus Peribacteraceae bacterium]|nr:30S ribosomal protein S20 [Candidatus Peribacteraceae bacterium]
MPLLKASIKHARQSEERNARRQPYKTGMKTQIKKIHDLVKEGKNAEAAKVLPVAFKAIDTAAKKNIIHWKNAAKKKSALARKVSPKK